METKLINNIASSRFTTELRRATDTQLSTEMHRVILIQVSITPRNSVQNIV